VINFFLNSCRLRPQTPKRAESWRTQGEAQKTDTPIVETISKKIDLRKNDLNYELPEKRKFFHAPKV